jgi:3-methyl-2-oxobutanoate hydroxymethyltransferase
MLGIFEAFTPKFVKKYANLAGEIVTAFQEYVDEVRSGKFPEEQYCYKMKAGEAEKFIELLSKSS